MCVHAVFYYTAAAVCNILNKMNRLLLHRRDRLLHEAVRSKIEHRSPVINSRVKLSFRNKPRNIRNKFLCTSIPRLIQYIFPNGRILGRPKNYINIALLFL